jgi:dipeptidase E
MSRLFLSSSFADSAKLFSNTIGEPCEGKSVAFIPTASIPEKMKFYVGASRKAFLNLGMRVNELEISTATGKEISEVLTKCDYVYISGGNTFFLLQELKKTGTDKLLVDLISSGKYFIGESAGSIIASPNIDYVKGMDDCRMAPELNDNTALNLVDFYPVPHYTNFPFKKAVEKIIAEYGQKITLYPISNGQAILVDGNRVEVLSK